MSGRSGNVEEVRARLKRLVALDHAYSPRAVREGTAASVLILISVSEVLEGGFDRGGDVEVLITRRSDRVETHKGQYALPGGMRDPEDRDLLETALRENEEEMGISRDLVEALGAFPPIWTPSGFLVTPVVGLLRESRHRIEVRPSEHEIDLWFWCALSRLDHPETYRSEEKEIVIDGRTVFAPIDVFQIDDHRVWGVTGAILKNFLERWKLSGEESSASLNGI